MSTTIYTLIANTLRGAKTTQFVKDENGQWFERHILHRAAEPGTGHRFTHWKRVNHSIVPPLDRCSVSMGRVHIRKHSRD